MPVLRAISVHGPNARKLWRGGLSMNLDIGARLCAAPAAARREHPERFGWVFDHSRAPRDPPRFMVPMHAKNERGLSQNFVARESAKSRGRARVRATWPENGEARSRRHFPDGQHGEHPLLYTS